MLIDKSDEIYLRPLLKKDINKRYISWFSDVQVTKFLDARNITKKESIYYLQKGIDTGQYYILAICYSRADLHIGNIKIGPIRRKDGLSDLVTVIGDRNYWGKGFASKAIKKAINIAFREGGMRKFIASIDSLNIASVKSYLKGGFTVESKIKDYFFHEQNGKSYFSDKIFVSCANKNYDISILNNWKIK